MFQNQIWLKASSHWHPKAEAGVRVLLPRLDLAVAHKVAEFPPTRVPGLRLRLTARAIHCSPACTLLAAGAGHRIRQVLQLLSLGKMHRLRAAAICKHKYQAMRIELKKRRTNRVVTTVLPPAAAAAIILARI